MFLSPIDQEVNQAGAKHVGKSMYQEERQEIFDQIFVDEVVEKSDHHTNDEGWGHALVGVKWDTDDSRVDENQLFMLVLDAR